MMLWSLISPVVMLVPVDKQTGKKRPLSDIEKARLKREHQKAAWNNRNPESKWKK